MSVEINTDFLIVGAGPSGASLAGFLGQNGMKGLVISKSASTSDGPRAHGFNPFAFETLRDIDIEYDGLQRSTRGSAFTSLRWARSMVGEEWSRVLGYHKHPDSMGDASSISPCEYVDFPQSQLEPLLVEYAMLHNFQVRFSTELLEVAHVRGENNKVESICTVRDLFSQQTYKIRTQYIFGADGARSHVARSLDFNFDKKDGGAQACNVFFHADLHHVMGEERHAALHWILKPDRVCQFGLVTQFRVVRPSTEWVMVCFRPGGVNPVIGMTPESPELIEILREAIGDDTVDIKVRSLDPWTVRESVAEEYARTAHNVFLVGDSAHRHPPTFGLGLNTCLQDAYNLAWKIAYVKKGLAGPGLLKTYSQERQPVGATIVRESNNAFRWHSDIWRLIGMFAPDREAAKKQVAQLSEASAEGEAAREELHNAFQKIGQEVRSLGLAYNQWYTSEAVYLKDEEHGRPELEEGNFITKPQVSTYPGSRVPHAWLDRPAPRKMFSTQDLVGKGSFCLLLGVGGDPWREAAKRVADSTGIPINVYGIGYGQEFIDVHRDWRLIRGVADDGCVLVRPDRFVAWRSNKMIADCEDKLRKVFRDILCRPEM